jgi:hypothetical protein
MDTQQLKEYIKRISATYNIQAQALKDIAEDITGNPVGVRDAQEATVEATAAGQILAETEKQMPADRYVCVCGSVIKKEDRCIKRHNETIKHRNFMRDADPVEEPKQNLCECGSLIKNEPRCIKRHLLTKKHKDYVNGEQPAARPATQPITRQPLQADEAAGGEEKRHILDYLKTVCPDLPITDDEQDDEQDEEDDDEQQPDYEEMSIEELKAAMKEAGLPLGRGRPSRQKMIASLRDNV